MGWEDKWNGYIKVYWKNIDPSLLYLVENNGNYQLSLTVKKGFPIVAEVNIKSKQLPKSFMFSLSNFLSLFNVQYVLIMFRNASSPS